jgi:hypothetical protein
VGTSVGTRGRMGLKWLALDKLGGDGVGKSPYTVLGSNGPPQISLSGKSLPLITNSLSKN